MSKKHTPKKVFWFYTKGMIIFFSFILLAIIIGIIAEVYIVSCLATFIFVYGNMTLIMGDINNKKEDYAARDGNNGSDLIGNYDGPKDQYLDRF